MSKHIRNVKQGLWAEHGKALLKLGERQLETWAIFHVLRYENTRDTRIRYTLPDECAFFAEWNYKIGFNEYVNDYQERYGEDFNIAITRTAPMELLV